MAKTGILMTLRGCLKASEGLINAGFDPPLDIVSIQYTYTLKDSPRHFFFLGISNYAHKYKNWQRGCLRYGLLQPTGLGPVSPDSLVLLGVIYALHTLFDKSVQHRCTRFRQR